MTDTDLIKNGGFDAGFEYWVATSNEDSPTYFLPPGNLYVADSESGQPAWFIRNQPLATGFFPDTLISGNTNYNEFDGSGGDFVLSQQFRAPVDKNETVLTFTFAAASTGYSGDPRTFDVNIVGQDGVSTTVYSYTLPQGGNSWSPQTVTVNLGSALRAAGNGTDTLEFVENVPGDFTGPAEFGIDNIAIDTPVVGGGATPEADFLTETGGNDNVSGLAGNDTISGYGGDDLIYGNQGADLIYGNQGDDKLFGGQGNDVAYGGQGSDIVYGNKGDDIIYGNRGDDVLYGGQGNDVLYSGQGNDVLFGGKGDDTMTGGLGNDTFSLNPGDTDFKPNVSTGDTITDFVTGEDKIDFTQGPAGTAANFAATSTTSKSFATIQATAQGLLNGGETYAFVTDGADGFLFTTGGSGTAIEDVIKLTGASSTTSLHAGDISGGR